VQFRRIPFLRFSVEISNDFTPAVIISPRLTKLILLLLVPIPSRLHVQLIEMTPPFYALFAKQRKAISFVMAGGLCVCLSVSPSVSLSVRPSIRMKQLGSHHKNFHEI
jgi:hypothetical protein